MWDFAMIEQLLPWVAGALVLALGWAVDRRSAVGVSDVVVGGSPLSASLGRGTHAIDQRPAAADDAHDSAHEANDSTSNQKSLGHGVSVLP